MLRIDRCREMDKLINFLSPIRIIVQMPDRIAFSDIVQAQQLGILLHQGNPKYTYWPPVAAATRGFNMVLFTASRRNTFVRGKSKVSKS